MNGNNGERDRVVYALEPTRHDVSDASRYGPLVYLYDMEERRPSMWTNAFLEDCMNRMVSKGFEEERDYFLVSGSHTPVTLLVIHLVSTLDTVNLLLFDAVCSEYVHKMIT